MDPLSVSSATTAIQAAAPRASTFTADALMNGGATLVGAFLGAMIAFVLQLVLQHKQDRKNNLLSAHRILFCLLQQTNTILLTQKDFFYPHLKHPLRFITIPAIHEFDISKNLFDFASFGFLLESMRGRVIMYDLYMAQENYIEAMRALNDRSAVHRDDVQPKLAAAGIGSGASVGMSDIHNALGILVLGTIISSTEQSLDAMSRAFKKLAAVKIEFRAHAVDYFNSNDFTDFDFPETFGLTGAVAGGDSSIEARDKA
jgi:hypothetical protein